MAPQQLSLATRRPRSFVVELVGENAGQTAAYERLAERARKTKPAFVRRVVSAPSLSLERAPALLVPPQQVVRRGRQHEQRATCHLCGNVSLPYMDPTVLLLLLLKTYSAHFHVYYVIRNACLAKTNVRVEDNASLLVVIRESPSVYGSVDLASRREAVMPRGRII